MPSNTADSMFGGAGGRGSRASVASLEGLRNVLRNEVDRDSARPAAPAAAPAAAAAAPAAPADDKKTLRGLNERLSGYLDRVKQLREENDNLEKQIDEILAKRTALKDRDWDETEKPVDVLKDKIKDITMDNAKLILQIDNTKMANDDFKDKADHEKKACEELERDLEVLRKTAEDTRLNCEQKQKEIALVKDELVRLKLEHKDDVEALREKIRESEVKVEIDSQNSNLAENLNKIRSQYDKLAQRNQKEADEWYQNKFENTKVVEAQKVEVVHFGKRELKDLLKERQILEIRIQSLQSMIKNLEQTLRNTENENGRRLEPLNKVILELAAELEKVKSQVEHQVETNQDLLCVKMKLELEINNYQQLILGMTTDTDGLEFSLDDVLQSEQQVPYDEVPERQEDVKEEAIMKQENTPSNKSTLEAAVEVEVTEAEVAAVNAAAQNALKNVQKVHN